MRARAGLVLVMASSLVLWSCHRGSVDSPAAGGTRATPRQGPGRGAAAAGRQTAIARGGDEIVWFPSRHAAVGDPSGRYAVVCEEASGKAPHRLYLKTLPTGKIVRVFEFPRHVDILWSRDGDYFAVTDWFGSDRSRILVFESAKPRAIDLARVVARQLGEFVQILGNDHVYYEAVYWADSRTLRFKVFGYGDHDRNGFELTFTYDVKGIAKRA